MESRAKLLQILEQSACLKPDQLTGYAGGTLFEEELRVVELHLASCQLCREALEGMEKSGRREALINELSLPLLPVRKDTNELPEPGLKENHPPKVVKTMPGIPKSTFNPYPGSHVSHAKNLSWLGITGIAVLLLLGGVLFWQYQSSLPEWTSFAFESGSSSKNLLLDSNRQEASSDSLTRKVASSHAAPVKEGVNNHDATPPVPVAETEAVNPVPEQPSGQEPASPAIAAAQTQPSVATTETTSKQEEKPVMPVKSVVSSPGKVAQPKEQSVKAAPKAPPAKVQQEDDAADTKPSDYTIGLRLYQKKQYASALLYLQTAAGDAHHPNHWDAVYYSALCNLEIGKNGRAKRLLKSIIKADVPLSKKAEEQLEKI